ncbi:uncharacterized protein K444DRAFT_614974 [Hyaloscypha bicolor E]|uniref:Uncharacterized protein n=1 Tax=Hyaloscypha bicolor E TaxID=1095630 RepID=A0A2J6T3F8_9HELO|nr:uncharacterized protein K444DRAFT_614974 [Hyaloscypha bicolor E]PMD57570.1 hypothetical protein K444DRAFT_614974 [Hyaloscypha bicolor E]
MGILFGFVAIFLVVIVAFGLTWRLWNIREEKKETERKRVLIEEGWGIQDGVGEKGKQRVVRDFRSEREEQEEREEGERGRKEEIVEG